MKPIRLLALDLDGTILTPDKRLTKRTTDAITHAALAGVKIVYITGRPLSGFPQELADLSSTRYVITSNGAVTTDISNGHTLRSALIEPDIAREIVQLPRTKELVYNVFINGIGYCERAVYDILLDTFAGSPLEAYVRRSRRPTEDITRLIDSHTPGVENIWIMGKDSSQRDRIDAFVQNRWMLNTMFTAGSDIEITAPDADKGHALTSLAESLKIQREEILAIGDNENDLGMLRVAGTAVAMGNATAPVRELADYITDTNDQDGAAKAIERFCFRD